MKRTDVALDGRTISVGLTHPDQDYPFREWLQPGERWKSTWTFIGLYIGEDPREINDGPVSDFTRKHLGTRISKITEKPVFVYNTWQPFRRNINEEMMYELATAAANCGVDKFVIDDGWQTNNTDAQLQFLLFRRSP